MTLWVGLKALHVVAVLAFVSGLLVLCIALAVLRHASTPPAPHERRLFLALGGWDRLVTTPALALVWALGLALASHGGWWAAGWLQAKLVLVVGLSALHGILAGRLRRVGGPQAGVLVPRWAGAAILAAMGLIVVLAVGKPF